MKDSTLESLHPIQVAAALDGETLILDIRGPSAWRKARLPGAVSAKSGEITSGSAADIDRLIGPNKGRRIIVYGSDGVARRAVVALAANGFRNAAYLVGGLRAWRDEGRTIETGVKDSSSERTGL